MRLAKCLGRKPVYHRLNALTGDQLCQHSRAHRGHVRQRPGQYRRNNVAAKGRLQLHQSSLVIDIQANAVSSKAQLQPPCYPGSPVPTAHSGGHQHCIRLMLLNGFAQQRSVRLRIVVPQRRSIRQANPIRTMRRQH